MVSGKVARCLLSRLTHVLMLGYMCLVKVGTLAWADSGCMGGGSIRMHCLIGNAAGMGEGQCCLKQVVPTPGTHKQAVWFLTEVLGVSPAGWDTKFLLRGCRRAFLTIGWALTCILQRAAAASLAGCGCGTASSLSWQARAMRWVKLIRWHL